jgi:ATP-binding cassette, subfamily B, multidrug efflux pump
MVAGVMVLVMIQAMADLSLPRLMAGVVDQGIAKGNTSYIVNTGVRMLLVAILSTLSGIAAGFLGARTAMGFGRDMRSRVFSHVEGFSLYEFDKFGTASLITRTTNDINQMQMVVLMGMRMVIMSPMMLIGGVIMAMAQDRGLAVVFFAVLPILATAIYMVQSRATPLFMQIQKKVDKLNLVLRENLTGIRVIRAFNRVDYEKTRFDAASEDLMETSITVNKLMAVLMPFMMLTLNFTTIAIMWIGAQRVNLGDLAVGSMMAFIQYASQILWSLMMLSSMFILIPRAAASAERIIEVLDSKPEVNDPAAPQSAGKVHGYLSFEDVTFSYPGAERPALSHVTFDAKPGEVTAIIGGTGSGKSTLVNLIPRFYDVNDGSIKVDGIDIRQMTQKDLRGKIGLIPQKAVLFTGSVTENILSGKEDATQEEIKHASDVAQATEFVTQMKEGFDSILAQGGANVSGGQKQRLSIARALVRRPEIYIFDDSFSALDFRTDARLRAELKAETKEATVLIVAQRESTVMDADRIIVLSDGEVVGIGTHRELLKSSPVYREIVASQLSEEEIA